MSIQENVKIAQTVYEAFNTKDVERALAQYGETVEIVNVPMGMTFSGHEGYKQFIHVWMDAFPDAQVEITHMAANDNSVVTEFRGRGSHAGPLAGPTGPIPPTGRSVDIPFCEVQEIQGGKIVKDRLYFDAATMLRQLGLA